MLMTVAPVTVEMRPVADVRTVLAEFKRRARAGAPLRDEQAVRDRWISCGGTVDTRCCGGDPESLDRTSRPRIRKIT
jgi:hypothetical protein